MNTGYRGHCSAPSMRVCRVVPARLCPQAGRGAWASLSDAELRYTGELMDVENLTSGVVYTFHMFPDDGEDFVYQAEAGTLVNLTTPGRNLSVFPDGTIRNPRGIMVATVRDLVPVPESDPLLTPHLPHQL